MKPFTERTIQIIQEIPSGTVMTYGQIAKLAGSPRGARQVVRVLHTLSQTHQLKWHRVINSKGEIAIKDLDQNREQAERLEDEGVKVHNGKVDLSVYQHFPEEHINDVDII